MLHKPLSICVLWLYLLVLLTFTINIDLKSITFHNYTCTVNRKNIGRQIPLWQHKALTTTHVLMYLRAFRTYKSVVMYSCISEHSERTSQWLCTHVSLSIQNLQVSSYTLVYLRAFRTYKSVVMYSCIAEHSELTGQ